jgi:hypothetical protein
VICNLNSLENWSNSLLSALDEAVIEGDRRSCSRILAAIAELLACKAGSQNGLRSGPASNSAWKPAFEMLKVRNFETNILLTHIF